MYSTDLVNGAKAFHPSVPYMKNSCAPNSYSALSQQHTLIVRASRDIKQGEPVTRCFSDVMKCNLFRYGTYKGELGIVKSFLNVVFSITDKLQQMFRQMVKSFNFNHLYCRNHNFVMFRKFGINFSLLFFSFCYFLSNNCGNAICS